jgi:hypothetical protein
MALKLEAQIALDGSGFQAGLNKVEAAAGRFGRNVIGLIGGAFTVGAAASALKGLTVKTIEFADRIGDASQRLGVSTDFLQAFEFAAKKSGASVDDLVGAIEKLNSARVEALSGPKDNPQLQAFARLGVSKADLQSNIGTEQIVLKIAAAFKTESAQSLIPAFREIAGRGAGALVATFRNDLDAEMNKAPLISPEQIALIKGMRDQLSALSQVVTAQTAPALINTTKALIAAGFGVKSTFAFLQAGLGGKNILKAGVSAVTVDPAGFINAIKNFDAKKGQKAQEDVLADMVKFFLELDAIMKDAAKDFRNPPTPNFSGIKPKATAGGIGSPEGDSLSRVGNFLGQSQGPIVQIGERTNQLLTGIHGTLLRIESKKPDAPVFPNVGS